MNRFVRGITLTPEERASVGLCSPDSPSGAGGAVNTHRCQVPMPDGSNGTVDYTRHGLRSHDFTFAAPFCQRIWISERLSGGILAVENKARELAAQVFRQAQQEEQKAMRRKTPPRAGTYEKPTGGPQMDKESACRFGGQYAVCVRFSNGRLLRIGLPHPDPDVVVKDLHTGEHHVQLMSTQRLVVGICCSFARCFMEPHFLADRPSSPSPEEIEPVTPPKRRKRKISTSPA